MKVNNEVTLKIVGDFEEFTNNLLKKGYKNSEHYILYDIFMIPENLEIEKMTTREIISKAIIIRKVDDIGRKEIRRDISYKMKKFNSEGEILEQKSIRCKVLSCKDAETFMSAIGYKTIMNIEEEDFEYTKDGFSIATKNIKNGDKLIEAETQLENEELDTIEKLKNRLIDENMKLDFSDCFIKKAEVELNKILGR